MKLQFSKWEILALIGVSLVSFLANLPEDMLGNVISRKFLLGALVAVVVIAMFRYLQVLLLMIITILAIGANLPHELAQSLGISQPALLICLGMLVALTVANRAFDLLPTTAEELESPDDEDELDLSEGGVRDVMLNSIARGDIGTVRKLIDMGTPVNFSLDGTTPLHRATEKGYSNIVQLLIDNGANLLAQNADGNTALDVALDLKKFARTTQILYEATVPLLSAPRS